MFTSHSTGRLTAVMTPGRVAAPGEPEATRTMSEDQPDQQTELADFADEPTAERLTELEARLETLEAGQQASVDIIQDVVDHVEALAETVDTSDGVTPPESNGYEPTDPSGMFQ